MEITKIDLFLAIVGKIRWKFGGGEFKILQGAKLNVGNK